MNYAVFCDSFKVMCTSNFYSQLFFFFFFNLCFGKYMFMDNRAFHNNVVYMVFFFFNKLNTLFKYFVKQFYILF